MENSVDSGHSKMKRAKIINIFSSDIEDLATYAPEDPDNFNILIQICVGIANQNNNEESGETFDIEIYTPKWLISNFHKNDILLVKHALIVFEYNYELIYQKLKQLIESCTGESWNEIALKIGKFAAWEFEDYDSHSNGH